MENSVPIQKTKVFRVKVDLDRGNAFEEQCKIENTNVNARLKELIDFSLSGKRRFFFAGQNIIKYDKTSNTFGWFARLDSGKEVGILNNLSDNFIKSLKAEIDKAIQERNDWAHQKKPDSIAFPGGLVGGEDG